MIQSLDFVSGLVVHIPSGWADVGEAATVEAMFDHVAIHVADLAASERFYRTTLGVLGVEPTHRAEDRVEWGDFHVVAASSAHPPTQHLHLGFVAPSRDRVDGFWRAGIDAGYEDDGPPGERPQYTPGYYGAFLRDPDGNSIEAVRHDFVRRGGHIDHLWIRVSDLDAVSYFYASTMPQTGLREGRHWTEGCQFRGAWATFSLVADGAPITEHLEIAFPAPDRQTVDDFHREAIAAGGVDVGSPGRRPGRDSFHHAATARSQWDERRIGIRRRQSNRRILGIIARMAARLKYVDPNRAPGLFSRVFAALANTRLGRFMSVHVVWKVDPYLMRATRGRLGMGLVMPTALLETRGAKSGAVRRNVVIYFHDGDRVTIVASKLGYARHPAWFHNLQANPDVTFGGIPMRATVVGDDAERQRLWTLADRVFAPYAAYRREAAKVGRTIPIVQLTVPGSNAVS